MSDVLPASSRAEFTPGPWGIDGYTDGRAYAYGVSAYREGFRGTPVVVWRGIAKPASAEGLANARLIAAAPALYEAIRAFVEAEDAMRADLAAKGELPELTANVWPLVDNMRAALALVTGEGK